MHNTSQSVKLFDRRFVANTLRNARRCPRCRSEYSHNYDKRMGDIHVKSNRPFLLSCGHNMCENCIYHHRTNLNCSVCLHPIEIDNTDQLKPQHQHQRQGLNFQVRDHFDMNFFLLGEINHFRFYRYDGSANNTIMSSHQTALANLDSTVVIPKCSECEVLPAMGICRSCKVHFCKKCFKLVHMHSKVLKSHYLTYLNKDRRGERKNMPKPKYCRRHQRVCDRYCQKCRLICCGQCAHDDHFSHGYASLQQENESYKEELTALMESVKTSRESLRKAHKDVKTIDMQLEEYASQILEDISSYFLNIHSFLQSEERRIMDEFSNKCEYPQMQIRETYTKLGESQTTLNKIRSNLELYQSELPRDVHLRDVIKLYHTELEQVACQVQITKINKNPFSFQSTDNIRDVVAKCYSYSYNNPQMSIHLGPIYGDLSRSFQDTLPMEAAVSTLNSEATVNAAIIKKAITKRKTHKKNSETGTKASHGNQVIDMSVENISGSHHTLCGSQSIEKKKIAPNHNNKLMVRISHVMTPEHFYVQRESSLTQIRELSNSCINYTHQEMIPKTITEGQLYMTYNTSDKRWYRGLVKIRLSTELYKVFLVDIGMHLEVSKQKLRDLDEKIVQIPYAAIRCAIHDIMPAKKSWDEDANNLLIGITRNKNVCLSIMHQIEDNNWEVDIFTTDTQEPISVRDSFLYTGLARERSDEVNLKLWPKKMSPRALIHQRLPKYSFSAGDMLMVQIVYVEDPQEFYAVKLDQVQLRDKLCEELNYVYDKNNGGNEMVYLATLQMCCAVHMDNYWHRACVEQIQEAGFIRVRLVDVGSQMLVSWRQIFVLKEQFNKQKEFSFKCTLADIEPLQENNYAWTEEAIKEFKQLTSNPTLQMTICSTKMGEYKATLHISKRNLDINIGAVLVKYGYGLSTGEATLVAEVFKTPKKRLNTSINKLVATSALHESTSGPIIENSKPGSTMRVLKRTPIKITHIVSPGEFYIQLSKLIPGIMDFHQQIQQYQRNLNLNYNSSGLSQSEAKEWFVGDHCLVYTDCKDTIANELIDVKDFAGPYMLGGDKNKWYRGIIIGIFHGDPESFFAIFLRDIGITLSSIRRFQLRTIERKWDCVSNAVYRCNLACVVPTGGSNDWSLSAIDCFKHTVSSFEDLSATSHSNRLPGSNSVPIMLWGTSSETADPLAPCIAKYSNINRVLVSSGLAHLSERLDVTLQLDKVLEEELAEDEITLEKWFSNFSTIEHSTKLPCNDINELSLFITHENDEGIDDNSYQTLLSEELESKTTTYSTSAPQAWLKSMEIEKSMFVAYPTYVDYDCVIYLHDADSHALLTQMRAKIEKAYSERPISDELPTAQYAKEQACIAKYHLDNHMYRGIVMERIKDKHELTVLFIDYGNVESVKPTELRPFAPFPNLRAIASKYRIDGIRPKNGENQFSTSVLDIIHNTIVDKLVSVRIASRAQPTDGIKFCSIRFGAIDLAQFLIEQDLVEADTLLPNASKAIEVISDCKKLSSSNKMHHLKKKEGEKLHVKPKASCAVIESKDTENKFDIFEKVDKLISSDEDIFDIYMTSYNADEKNPFKESATLQPPPKKRMFDSSDYKKMHTQLLYGGKLGDDDDDFDLDLQDENIDDAPASGFCDVFGIEDEDQDVVELEHSFALNYWHTQYDVDDVNNEVKNEVESAKNNKKKLLLHLKHHQQFKDDSSTSEFEKFDPRETSSVFSHVSGIASFTNPQLPSGIRKFKCSVVLVVTSTLLQIFPHLSELEYREVELQNRIKYLAMKTLPLTIYEPRTICLARYSKDKKWYRAVIRAYNPSAKEANVLYVDYLNAENIPIIHLKRYPVELASWPLRTFKVRLHSIMANPRMREKDVCHALHKVIRQRTLYAHVKKESKVTSTFPDHFPSLNSVAGSIQDDGELMEISLYDTKDATTPVYKNLIQDNFYIRI